MEFNHKNSDERDDQIKKTLLEEIDERKKSEKALEKEKKLLNVIMENTGAMLVYLDCDFNFIRVNKAYAGTSKYRPEEMIGKNLFDLYPDGENQAIFARVRDTGESVKYYDKPFVFADHPEKGLTYCDWTLVPVKDSQGHVEGLVLSLVETTERKLLEEKRERGSRLESIGTLAGGIAHDFNNILTSIMGNIELASIYARADRKVLEKLEEAEKACTRAKNLTQQLLTFSHGGMPIKRPISIAKLLRESVNFSLRGSNVKPLFSIQDDLRAVEADEGQIGQVITNMVINSWEAMPHGGTINITATNMIGKEKSNMPLNNEGKYVEITIEDHGIGIKKEFLPRIFDPYFTTKQKGSGLGLATVYSIIKKHDGYIHVESTQGVGTIFRIYLPASDKEIPDDKNVRTSSYVRGKGKVLVMDDEDMIRELLQEMLFCFGYESETVCDGKEAIESYAKALESGNPFDVVIMDLTIPGGMGGKEAIKKLREIDPDAKVVVSSGYANDPVMAHYTDYGFSAVVIKPYSVEEMENTLGELLQRPKHSQWSKL